MNEKEYYVEVVNDPEPSLIEAGVKIEKEAFGKGGLFNPWLLAPFARHGRVFMLKERQKIIGVAEGFREWNDHRLFYLFGLAITEGYRGKGLGKFFMTEIARILKEMGFSKIGLTVNPENEAAFNLYTSSLNFVVRSFEPDLYGKGENRLYVEMSLR